MKSLLIPMIVSVMIFVGCATKEAQPVSTNQAVATIDDQHELYFKNGITADASKLALVEGNKRFVSGEIIHKNLSEELRTHLAENGQNPFAIVINCSDSRTAPELIFDQGLGDLFVIRVAGNVADQVEIGSVEYAAANLGVPLIIVLGHEKCGAVKAAIEGGDASASIKEIFNNIQPAIDKVKLTNKEATKEQLISLVEAENAKQTASDLLTSPTIKNLVEQGKVKIVSAKYDLETGEVQFLE